MCIYHMFLCWVADCNSFSLYLTDWKYIETGHSSRQRGITCNKGPWLKSCQCAMHLSWGTPNCNSFSCLQGVDKLMWIPQRRVKELQSRVIFGRAPVSTICQLHKVRVLCCVSFQHSMRQLNSAWNNLCPNRCVSQKDWVSYFKGGSFENSRDVTVCNGVRSKAIIGIQHNTSFFGITVVI